jgi:hypothetical protein
MSKFAEKLQRSYKTTAPPMGFHKNTAIEENPPLLLVADITRSAAKAAEDIAAGSDAVIINGAGLDTAGLNKLNRSGNGTPMGLIWDKSASITLEEIPSGTIDFVIFDVQAPVAVMNRQGLGKFLMIEPSLVPAMVKAVNDLGTYIDGVIVTSPSGTVTIESLLTCKLFSDLLSKPLLFRAGSTPGKDELECLYNSGANAVVLPAGVTAADIEEIKKTIAALPKKVRKKSSVTAVLPGIGSGSSSGPSRREEPGEDEDDDI